VRTGEIRKKQKTKNSPLSPRSERRMKAQRSWKNWFVDLLYEEEEEVEKEEEEPEIREEISLQHSPPLSITLFAKEGKIRIYKGKKRRSSFRRSSVESAQEANASEVPSDTIALLNYAGFCFDLNSGKRFDSYAQFLFWLLGSDGFSLMAQKVNIIDGDMRQILQMKCVPACFFFLFLMIGRR